MYKVALSAAACATALVIGPVSYHRTRFGRARGGDLLRTSIWLARAGMASLLIAAVSAVYLALDMGLGGSVAIAVTVPVALVFLTVWYFVPAFRQRHR